MTDRKDMVVRNKKPGDLLKLIAIITMVIDHIGVLLFPELRILRTIGRVAFPLFAWLLVQGFLHTSSRPRYGKRFLIFALIAQGPYVYLNSEMTPNYLHFNVMFLLLLGLLLLVVAEKSGTAFKEGSYVLGLLWTLFALGLAVLPDVAEYLNPDFRLSYGTYGLVMVLIFYWTRQQPVLMAIGYGLLSAVEPYRIGVYYRALYITPEMSYMEAFCSFDMVWQQIADYKDGLRQLEGYFFQVRSVMGLALILLLKKVPAPFNLPKYFGYAFYPIHILLLILIRVIHGGPIG